MDVYTAFGLYIRSELALPELLPAPDAVADVVCRLGSIAWPTQRTSTTEQQFHTTPEESYFFWNDIGTFVARHGNEIVVEPLPDVPPEIVRLPLLGVVLSATLDQRGIPTLHGSVIVIGEQAVAFLGASGDGKSTMAAALLARGHTLVADDMAVLASSPDGVLVLPGFAQLKLFPESAALLGDDTIHLRRLLPDLNKYAKPLEHGFVTQPTQLKHIYVLQQSDDMCITRMPPQEAFLHLFSQSFGASVFARSLRRADEAALLRRYAAVINNVPIFWLRRPRAIELVPTVAEMIEEHCGYAIAATSV